MRTASFPRARPGAAASLLLALLLPSLLTAQPPVVAIAGIGMTVASLDQSRAFYRDVLGFEVEGEIEVSGHGEELLTGIFPVRARIGTLRLGSERIALTEYVTPRGRPFPLDQRSQDHSFQHLAIVVSDMNAAYARLRTHGVAHISPEPQRLPDGNPDAGGIEAFYFRDPDGHPLELIRFPVGKGAPRWQEGGRLFLGIDHTAIVVSDTEQALQFYRELLGLEVVGGSENHGPEQERLNAVRGARLRITALRASAGPGVELLEYLAPRDGRAAPEDAGSSDLLHRHILVEARGDRLRKALSGSWKGAAGSVATVTRAGEERRFRVKDPDGHILEVIER